MNVRCRLCGSKELADLLDLGWMPVAHRLLVHADDPEETFPFKLSLCPACSLIQIAQPIDPERLYRGYNYNFSSWKNEPHLDDELRAIGALLHSPATLEVGCNDGRFLEALRALGSTTCVGIEPNPAAGTLARERGFPVYEAMVGAGLIERIVHDHGAFDLVVIRQVLEHVLDVQGALTCARAALRSGGYLFIDVPDFAPSRDLGDCSTLWEEHVTYYTEATLTALLKRSGFEIMWTARYDFSGGTIALLARRSAAAEERALPGGIDAEVAAAQKFPLLVRAYQHRLTAALARARAHGVRTALYGVGVRGCTAVNALNLGPSLSIVFDDQPQRQGKFMPGTRLAVVSPHALAHAREPLLCVLAVNNENEAAVKARLDALVGRPVLYLSVCGPADIWADLQRLERESWAA